MFFSEHRLKMTSLRIGKHRIVKNIASLRKVNIAHPYMGVRSSRLAISVFVHWDWSGKSITETDLDFTF